MVRVNRSITGAGVDEGMDRALNRIQQLKSAGVVISPTMEESILGAELDSSARYNAQMSMAAEGTRQKAYETEAAKDIEEQRMAEGKQAGIANIGSQLGGAYMGYKGQKDLLDKLLGGKGVKPEYAQSTPGDLFPGGLKPTNPADLTKVGVETPQYGPSLATPEVPAPTNMTTMPGGTAPTIPAAEIPAPQNMAGNISNMYAGPGAKEIAYQGSSPESLKMLNVLTGNPVDKVVSPAVEGVLGGGSTVTDIATPMVTEAVLGGSGLTAAAAPIAAATEVGSVVGPGAMAVAAPAAAANAWNPIGWGIGAAMLAASLFGDELW